MNNQVQAEDGIRDRSPSRGLGDVYKRQGLNDLPGVECSLPGGAFYAFPKVSAVSYTHLTLPTILLV